MLEAVFAKVLQMSLVGCYSIGLVLAVRLLLIRCGRIYAYQLWILMFVSLCLPFSLPGNYSLIPRTVAEFSLQELTEQEEARQEMNARQEPAAVIHQLSPGENTAGSAPDTENRKKDTKAALFYEREYEETQDLMSAKEELKSYMNCAAQVWLLGVLLFAAYIFCSICRMSLRCIRYRERGCMKKDRIVETEDIPSPFLWGCLRPVIYLPSGLDREERAYILAHEAVHRGRMDHLIRFLILAAAVVHWFNPLVWIAYALCCGDMEISCDEAVLGHSENNIQKAYARSLLKYAARQNRYLISPLGFGDPSVKSRIRNVLRYRKKSIWVSAAAGVCVTGMAVGLLHNPVSGEEIAKDQVQEAKPLPEGEELPVDAEEGLVENNGGEILCVAGEYYYMQGMTLYSDGQALYTSVTEDDGKQRVCRYEPDGSNCRQILDGRIVDSTENGKLLYCMLQSDDGASECLGWYDTGSGASGRFSQEGADYLGQYGGYLYTSRREDDGLHLNRIRQIDLTEEKDLLGEGILADGILKIYADEGRDRLVFAAEVFKGEGGESEIQCYSYDLETGALIQKKELTGLPYFSVMDGYLYFQRYRSREDYTMELFRTDCELNNEEQVGEGLALLCTDEKSHSLLAEKTIEYPETGSAGSLVRVWPKEKEEQMLLDMGQMIPALRDESSLGEVCLEWDFQTGDRMIYSEPNLFGSQVYVTVSHMSGQRKETYVQAEDSLQNLSEEVHLTINAQGDIGIWEPERLTPGWEDDSRDTEFMVGQPVNLEQSGWDLEQVTDVREQPEDLLPDMDAAKKKQTYLLGETRYWTLYGNGDYRSMLLARNGRYTEINYPYMTDRRALPVLMEADLDQDKITELAILLCVREENGYSVDTLLVADFQNNGAWVYQLTEEELLSQLMPHVTSEPTGRQIRFSFDETRKKILVRTELEFREDADSAAAEYDGCAITAEVIWAEGHFGLHKTE